MARRGRVSHGGSDRPSQRHDEPFVGIACVAVAAVAAVAFANTLSHGFVWDDPVSIERWLPALPRVSDAFLPPPGIPQFPSGYYRPLQLLSYRLDYALGGGNPFAFHLSVVLWHILASVLVLLVARRLYSREAERNLGSVAAAALFAVHPIHSESVAWMAARPDVMAGALGLGAVLAYTQPGWTERRRASLAALLLFASLLCKEVAALFVVLVPAAVFVIDAMPGRRIGTTSCLALAGAVVIYVSLRWIGVPIEIGQDESLLPDNPLLVLVAAVGAYLRMVVLPLTQNARIADVPTSGADLAFAAVLILGVIGLFVRSLRRDDRLVVYCLAWTGLTLAPSFVVMFHAWNAPIAERYAYVPSIGVCWLFGIAVARLASSKTPHRRAIVGAVVMLVLVSGVLTVRRNRIWQDNVSLWTDTALRNPQDGFALRNLGTALLERGETDAAEHAFRDALQLRNDRHGLFLIYSNLGTLALGRGEDELAEAHYKKAVEIEPAADGLFNLGVLELRRGDYRAARERFEAVLDASPHDADIHVAIAQAAQGLGDRRAARHHLEGALRLGLDPERAAAVRKLLTELGEE